MALKLLNKTGMDIQDDDTRKRLKEIGCREDSDGYLMFDEDTVSQALLRFRKGGWIRNTLDEEEDTSPRKKRRGYY